MKILILKKNEMNDEVALALAQCSHNIEQLYLSDCSLTIIGWKTVFSRLANTNEKVNFVKFLLMLKYIQDVFLIEYV